MDLKMDDSIDMQDRPVEAKDREIDELRRQVTELEHALKLWKGKATNASLAVSEYTSKSLALENQVQSAELRLSEFKDAVMIVVRELARE